MNADLHLEERQPFEAIERLMVRHGAWRITAAVMGTLIRRRYRPGRMLTRDLPPHLRRDVGLPPEGGGRKHWELR